MNNHKPGDAGEQSKVAKWQTKFSHVAGVETETRVALPTEPPSDSFPAGEYLRQREAQAWAAESLCHPICGKLGIGGTLHF